MKDPFIFYQDPTNIYNTRTKINIVEKQYSCRQCNQNLASNNPASQYQRQKLIQNTVRVQSSLYTPTTFLFASSFKFGLSDLRNHP